MIINFLFTFETTNASLSLPRGMCYCRVAQKKHYDWFLYWWKQRQKVEQHAPQKARQGTLVLIVTPGSANSATFFFIKLFVFLREFPCGCALHHRP